MTMHNARLWASASIIFGHFFNILLLIFLWIKGGYTFDEMVNVFAIMAPLLATYISIVITFSFNIRLHKDRSPISGLAMGLSLLFPTSLWLFVCFGIFIKAVGLGITNMDQLIKFVGIVETIIGIYTGSILKNLFPSSVWPGPADERDVSQTL